MFLQIQFMLTIDWVAVGTVSRYCARGFALISDKSILTWSDKITSMETLQRKGCENFSPPMRQLTYTHHIPPSFLSFVISLRFATGSEHWSIKSIIFCLWEQLIPYKQLKLAKQKAINLVSSAPCSVSVWPFFWSSYLITCRLHILFWSLV